ncbi:MAG: hypothetical protein M1819_004642 [Sarea resinae]|nr:MAG: hypothetical protein M1819_004642 [Sarea resinae]
MAHENGIQEILDRDRYPERKRTICTCRCSKRDFLYSGDSNDNDDKEGRKLNAGHEGAESYPSLGPAPQPTYSSGLERSQSPSPVFDALTYERDTSPGLGLYRFVWDSFNRMEEMSGTERSATPDSLIVHTSGSSHEGSLANSGCLSVQGVDSDDSSTHIGAWAADAAPNCFRSSPLPRTGPIRYSHPVSLGKDEDPSQDDASDVSEEDESA